MGEIVPFRKTRESTPMPRGEVVDTSGLETSIFTVAKVEDFMWQVLHNATFTDAQQAKAVKMHAEGKLSLPRTNGELETLATECDARVIDLSAARAEDDVESVS